MLWSRKSQPIHERSRVVGLDLTASRARAVSVGGGKARAIPLDDPSEELLLFLAADRRSPDPGRMGYALCRKLPHSVCSNFLPSLAQPREWRNGRYVLTPESALELTFAKLRGPIAAESDSVALALPVYLAPNQVVKTVKVA